MMSFSQPWKKISTPRPRHRHLELSKNSSVPAEVAKLWGLFRPPLRHRRGLEKYMAETPWGCNNFERKPCITVAWCPFEVYQATIEKQNPSSNTRLYKPSETAQGPHHQGLFVGRFPTTPTIHKFPLISQFGLGCLDLFRSKASLIISTASWCSTPAENPHRGETCLLFKMECTYKQQGTIGWTKFTKERKRVEYLKQATCLLIYSPSESISFHFLGCWFLPAYHLGNSRSQGLKETLFVPFWASAPEIHRCTACLPSNGCVSPSPLMTPSSTNRPNTKPSPLQGRCCYHYHANPGSSGWSFVARPRPEPGRRHATWETRWSTQHTYSNTAHMPLCQCNLLPDWKSGLTIYDFYKERKRVNP